jgi:hypothetical protein
MTRISTLTFIGEYIIPDPALTALYLVPHSEGVEVPMQITRVNETELQAIIPTTVDTGRYTLKLVSGWRTAWNSALPAGHTRGRGWYLYP